MKKLLLEITKSIVDKPESIKIYEDSDESGLISFKLTVDPQDMGRIIGKQGKMISAIRSLIRVAARKKGLRARIELQEPEGIQTDQADKPEPKRKAVQEEKPDKEEPANKEIKTEKLSKVAKEEKIKGKEKKDK